MSSCSGSAARLLVTRARGRAGYRTGCSVGRRARRCVGCRVLGGTGVGLPEGGSRPGSVHWHAAPALSLGKRVVRRDLLVQRVELLGLATVNVKPPVADEVRLVKQSSIGAEEAVLGQPELISSANVKQLAVRLGVGVVAAVHLFGPNINNNWRNKGI